ncbi:MAG TPA: lipocalin family protein [Myxococcota bacterium]|nr:lipocalin family protein [Myxococcota bacterium]HRY91851.1 lipocalin family protein [Myxococcota bacterium]HSA20562.1 lipocalin family protein [Myxococcota bacterium]
MSHRLGLDGALALAALAALGCGLGACSSEGSGCPAVATSVRLPADAAPHDDSMEWWYYTGHLFAGQRRFGFELTIFQVDVGADLSYIGHAALTDLERGEHVYAQDIITRAELYPRFDLAVGPWSMRAEGQTDRLEFGLERYALSLELVPEKPPAIHGGDGLIDMGSDKTSFYYSKTRLRAAGSLSLDGQALAVSGQAWMDHQWGDFDVFGSDGWDWFSLQLEDGWELMLFLLHFTDGHVDITGGTLVSPEGCAREFTDFEIQATGEWVSPHTGAVYPHGWTLSVPDEGLELVITPALADQEVDSRATTLNVYWEGAVDVAGTHRGAATAGLGYVELAGYSAWGPESP